MKIIKKKTLLLLKEEGVPGKYVVKVVSLLSGLPHNKAYKIQLEIDKQ